MTTSTTPPATSAPPSELLIARAEANLARHLDWVSRFDSRSSVPLGACVGMTGFYFHEAPSLELWDVTAVLFTAATVLCLAAAFAYLWRGYYPDTDAPNDSLVYFDTIASMRVDDFRDKFCAQESERYLHDLCYQTHAIAKIMKAKFSFLKRAMAALMISVLPWGAGLLYFRALSQGIEITSVMP